MSEASSVADLAKSLDAPGVAKFKFPVQFVLHRNGVGEVLKDRLRAAIVADSEKV